MAGLSQSYRLARPAMQLCGETNDSREPASARQSDEPADALIVIVE
ncbi:MAG: hypothetical protein JO166_19815 [Deltaproteobacteria bacterium]|nr:hypothetical protein [Deltaproteobacteria bacterium]